MEVTRAALKEYFDGGPDIRVQPLPKYGCIYVKNPKAATSTVMQWLHRAVTGDHEFTPRMNIHAEHGLPRPKDVGWDGLARMLDGAAFRFTFVRDPIRRVESAYRDKIVKRRPRFRYRNDLQAALGMPEDQDRLLTPDEFLAALEATDPRHLNPHFRPQHLNLAHDLVRYDVIGRLETFEADLERIRQAVGLPEAPLEVRHASRRTDPAFDRPDLRRRVEVIYSRDLDLYGHASI